MNSEEIRATLKPFADFAPAIVKAAEICDAAENAEKVLAKFETDKVDIEKEIAEMRESQERVGAQTKALLNERQQARAENLQQLESLKQGLLPLKAEHAALTKAIADLAEQKESAIKGMKLEIAKQQDILSAIKGEISRLKNQFAA